MGTPLIFEVHLTKPSHLGKLSHLGVHIRMVHIVSQCSMHFFATANGCIVDSLASVVQSDSLVCTQKEYALNKCVDQLTIGSNNNVP